MLSAEGVSSRELPNDRTIDLRVIVAEDERPPGEGVIEELVVVDVEEIGAVSENGI